MHDFPYDFTDICRINFLELPKRGVSSNIDCPFCNSRKKLNINNAPNKLVARCNKCKWSGGMLAFHRDLNGLINNKDAKNDIEQKLGLVPNTIEYKAKSRLVKKAAVKASEAEVTLSINERNRCYNQMASLLHLADDHKDNLIKRGLSIPFIEARGYKTLPVQPESLIRLPKVMLKHGYSLENLPGFFLNENNQWSLRKLSRGILIPIRNLNGMIEGYQIRKDKVPYKTHKDDFTGEIIKDKNGKPVLFPYNKFCSLSTPPENFNKGGKMHSVCHYAGAYIYDEDRGKLIPVIEKNAIKFTEGALKADIYYALTGEPILGILGVNNSNQLKTMLEQLLSYYPNITTVQCCLDMDYLSNQNVKSALDKLESMVKDLGLRYVHMTWNPDYKGVDDFALAVKQGKYRRT